MKKAIQLRIYPSVDLQIYLANQFGCCRKVYNELLAYRKNEYELNNRYVDDKEFGEYLTKLKSTYSYLKDVHSKVLQQSMRDLNTAYKNFFDGLKKGLNIGYPQFKAKHYSKLSCRFPSDMFNRSGYVCDKIKGNRITLTRQLSNIHFKCSRKDESYLNKNQKYIRSVTCTKHKSGIFTLSILIDKNDIKKHDQLDTIIGLDLGIKDFIVDSNRVRYENLKVVRSNERTLKLLNRKMLKKQKGSNNRNKVRIRYAKFYEYLTNKKLTYLHQISSRIVNENQVICIEDLNVKGMMKNHNLAKSIQELSLSEFVRQLTYKSEWYGRNLVKVDRYYPSSKTCHECGHINKNLKLSDREWVCPVCGKLIDRDYNAALNIMDEGIRIFNQ